MQDKAEALSLKAMEQSKCEQDGIKRSSAFCSVKLVCIVFLCLGTNITWVDMYLPLKKL